LALQNHFAGNTSGAHISTSKDTKHPILSFNEEIEISDTQEAIIKYLFRGSRSADFDVIVGGYSGNLVLGTQSIDLEGRIEVPHVLKIGEQEEMGQERMSFEKVEQVLGNSAPRITDFVDYNDKGGIKYRYASMGKGESTTLQKIYCSGAPLDRIKKFLDTVFVEQLGRFYNAATFEKSNLMEYYQYDPNRAERLKQRIADVYEGNIDAERLTLIEGVDFPNPYYFYKDVVPDLIKKVNKSHFYGSVHGDLNGANIIIDSQDNVWLIDFFHTHRGHILKDLIKLENDLLYIYTPVESEEDLAEAIKLSQILFNVKDLARPLPDLSETGLTKKDFIRTYETIKILRGYYPPLIKYDRDPVQLLIGQQRYSLHTLMFFESNNRQKRWALYNSGYFGELMTKRIKTSGKLRVKWLLSDKVPTDSVGLTILPGRRDYSRSISEDLKELQQYGISCIVPLITDDELHDFGVDDLMKEYEEIGFEVNRLEIMDQMVCSENEMHELLDWMDERIQAGKKILVHCVGGLGRSGLVAASLLKSKGLSADEAIKVVRESRSPRAVESQVQEQFVHDIQFVKA